MKAIFLNQTPSKITEEVYPKRVIDELRAIANIDTTVYSREDVVSSEHKFDDVEYVFTTWDFGPMTEEQIQKHLPSLKAVFYAAGTVQYFAKPFLNCGIKVFSAWAANAVPVAEYTVAQIILAGKDFYCQSRLLKEKQWDNTYKRLGEHIGNYRKKIGLIGCGMIGSMVAEMLKDYSFEVLAYDPFMSEEKTKKLGVITCSLEELFATCSVVSNHLANNDATQKILRYEHFSSMPLYSTFINTGRGAQVVEEDLVRALTERPDLTALLDVTDPEPSPLDHDFYSLPNCFLTPHIAGSLGGEVVRMAEYMADEYEKYAKGQPCLYEVTVKMLETMA